MIDPNDTTTAEGDQTENGEAGENTESGGSPE
jgi:hypothetical protein